MIVVRMAIALNDASYLASIPRIGVVAPVVVDRQHNVRDPEEEDSRHKRWHLNGYHSASEESN
jgi:hypothetical protein